MRQCHAQRGARMRGAGRSGASMGPAARATARPGNRSARIAALIPPPRHPFLRYHGVLAPAEWVTLCLL